MKKSFGARTLIYPTPVWVVGTYDREGKPNFMPIAWGGICCSRPPCIAISIRKATYTYKNIVARKAFTLNVPSEEYVTETDFFGMVSGKDFDKFSVTGLTPVKSNLVDAPYVHEFPMILECKLIHTFEIGMHTQFVGEILDVKADESVIGERELPDIEKIKPFLFSPDMRTYHKTGEYLGKAFSIGSKLKK